MKTPLPKPRRKPAVLIIGTGAFFSLLAIGLFAPPGQFTLLLWAIPASLTEYVLYAVGFFTTFWVIFHGLIKGRKLARQRWPKISQLMREVSFSISTQIVFLAVGLSLAFTDSLGASNMYLEIGNYGWVYILFVTLLILVLDDTYFYWTHRALHHPALFEKVHRVHHESADPTPFTAYSFHPLEAIILGVGGLSILPIVMLMPWHPAFALLAGTCSILFNVIGHLGYEVYPRFWIKLPLLRWKTPGYHHYMHHQRVGGNYGLYFRWWDRICGTEFKDFEHRYDGLFMPEQKPLSRQPEFDV